MSQRGAESVVVLCPLEIERKVVRESLERAGLARVAVERTGPGAGAVESAVRALGTGRAFVILAGLCGGLGPVDDVPVIDRVVDERGGTWGVPGAGGRGVALVGVDAPVCTVEAKRRLGEATGAGVVDMESHGLARACGGIESWAVIRGVSDRYDEPVPAQVMRWVGRDGRTRTGRVVGDMIRSPSIVPAVLRMGRRSPRVLRVVGERVVESVGGWLAGNGAVMTEALGSAR
ncbi:MAG: hypothetical protein KF745_14545 [Phycisphaeraceae bacterium]|nr:hypothetical protein [Phycisphaeraceae bacterium]